MCSFCSRDQLSATESVDIIEKIVCDYLKPMGFRRHGRTLHRFVEGDISQVVHFQNGCPGKGIHDVLWVNLGIRVPECAERSFEIKQPQKKYYQEYECNIRTRLGSLVDHKDTYYDLRKNPETIGQDIVDRLKQYVMPVFDLLNSRNAILTHRRGHTEFDHLNHQLILLDETMIFGRRGEWERAVQLFNSYYERCYAKYQQDLKYGSKIFLRKGERVTYKNWQSNRMETVTADKDGYVTVYNANPMHLRYLEELAEKLGITIRNNT